MYSLDGGPKVLLKKLKVLLMLMIICPIVEEVVI
jgi:hypothetical protein